VCLISFGSGEVNDSQRNVSYRDLDKNKVIILAGGLELPNNYLIWGQCKRYA